jgi:L-lactate permease
VNPGRTWLVYTLIRLGLFAGVLILLLVLQITPWLAAVIAALISLCISIIFLRKPREEASKTLYEARNNRGQAASRRTTASDDENVEDEAVDHAAGSTTAPAEPGDERRD